MNFIVILIQSIKKFIWDFVEKYIYRLIWREMPFLDCWFFAFINTKYIFFLIYFFLHTFCNFLNMFVFFLSISCTFLFHSFLSTLYFLLLWWVLFFYYILICLLGYFLNKCSITTPGKVWKRKWENNVRCIPFIQTTPSFSLSVHLCVLCTRW